MTVPARMTAIAIREPGKPEVLVPQERDTPAPKQGEVLVKVAAAGVNRPDVMQREGKYPPPPGAPDIPGLELAGEVVALGEGVEPAAPGVPGDRPRNMTSPPNPLRGANIGFADILSGAGEGEQHAKSAVRREQAGRGVAARGPGAAVYR